MRVGLVVIELSGKNVVSTRVCVCSSGYYVPYLHAAHRNQNVKCNILGTD